MQATPLIGRERELAELMTLADSRRLITLTGTGGTGKTRLGVAFAAGLADRYPDGVWWVPLAMVSEARLVPAAIAAVLGDSRICRCICAGERCCSCWTTSSR